MCNLSLAASKHREDAAQRGRLRRGAAIHQSRLTEGRRNSAAALQIVVRRRRGRQCAETYWQKADIILKASMFKRFPYNLFNVM